MTSSKDRAPTTERMPHVAATTIRPREPRPAFPGGPEVTITKPLPIPTPRERVKEWRPAAPEPSDRVHLPPRPRTPPSASDESSPLPGWVWPYVIFVVFFLFAGVFLLWLEARVLGHF
jgi:hypothetical protein